MHTDAINIQMYLKGNGSILRNSDHVICETSKLEGGKTFLIIIRTVDDKFLQALSSLSLSVVVEYLKILLFNCHLKKFHCQEHFLNIWNDFEYLIAMISLHKIFRSTAWRTCEQSIGWIGSPRVFSCSAGYHHLMISIWQYYHSITMMIIWYDHAISQVISNIR